MNRTVLVLAVVATLAVAGCLGGGSEAETATQDTSAADGSGSGSGGSDASADDGPEPRANATLQESPDIRVGDWWTVEVQDPVQGTSYTVKQVVASKHGDTYDVGIAKSDFQDGVVIAHWPPVGEVAAQDLAFSIHNADFKPVKFPLQEGQSWETSYAGQDGWQGEVNSTSGTTAEIVYTRTTSGAFGEDTDRMQATYDAETRTVTSFSGIFGVEMSVTDMGSGFQGDVVVPHGRSQYFDGRLVGAINLEGQPDAPTGSVDVSEPEASVALIAGSIPISGQGSPGAYRETAVTPGDTTFQLQTPGTEGLVYQYEHVDDAQGTWEFEHVAGGVGAAATEIIAYEKLVIPVDAETVPTS